MSIAQRYEVELKVSRLGQEPKSVVRIEHAYSPMDAIMQAGLNHAGENPGEQAVAFLHVAPPADAIETLPEVTLLLQQMCQRLKTECDMSVKDDK